MDSANAQVCGRNVVSCVSRIHGISFDCIVLQMIFEGNTRDMVVPDSISGDSEEEIDAGCEGMDLEEVR